ncbi:unnamed protein product [Amoebophrya sp. A25]|nr:unnamed protein product [Amoebophrya sp. A25]|eukprot:GSA25T00020924001.1
MWHDRALAQDPVRYTAATMEMMRLEDVPTLRCAVNYACDHSYGHLANAVSATYFANKEWISKDQAKAAFIQEQSEKNPELQRQKLLRRAEKNLAPPYAWDGKGTFYGHKETSCFGYVTAKGRHRADLTGSTLKIPTQFFVQSVLVGGASSTTSMHVVTSRFLTMALTRPEISRSPTITLERHCTREIEMEQTRLGT